MLAMIDRLDIVPVGVEQESGVIARMIGALAGRAIVASACCKARFVKGLDHRAIGRLEGKVMASGELAERRRAVCGRHEQFVRPEIVGFLPADRHIEHFEDRAVEFAARLQVSDDQLDMVDQAAAMQLLRFHALHSSSARPETRPARQWFPRVTAPPSIASFLRYRFIQYIAQYIV